jgi:hypothetical protein
VADSAGLRFAHLLVCYKRESPTTGHCSLFAAKSKIDGRRVFHRAGLSAMDNALPVPHVMPKPEQEQAPSEHASDAEQCLLSEAKQTWPKDGVMSAYDPKRTKGGLKSRSAAVSCQVCYPFV